MGGRRSAGGSINGLDSVPRVSGDELRIEMPVDVFVFNTEAPTAPETSLVGTLLANIDSLLARMTRMNDVLETLTARVAAIETVGSSAVTLLNGLREALDAAVAGGDMAVVADLNERLAVQTADLAAAVAANTMAASEPVPEPEPELPLPVDTDQSPQ